MKRNKIFLLLLLFLLVPVLCFSQEADPIEEDKDTHIEDIFEEAEEMDDDGLISVKFQDTDIKQAIEVLGDLTGTVIIPHKDLEGKVNIVSLEKVEPEVIINIIESALQVKGFTLIKSGSALKVVPLGDTTQSNVQVNIGITPGLIKDTDLVITQVMPIKYSSALKLKTVLQPLVGKHGNIIANERTNTLVITDSSSNIKRLATIIQEMEHPQPAKTQVKTYVLNYGDVTKIAKILSDLSSEEKAAFHHLLKELDQDTSLEIFGEIQAYTEEETNAIVVASAPVNFPAIEKIIHALDVFPPQSMIEVVIMDVTLDDDFTMGVEYSDPTTPSSTTLAGAKNFFTDDNRKFGVFHSLLGLNTDASTAGFTYRIMNSKETFSVLGFILNSVENSKVLSTPRILASNNQESSITVGQEIPIIESSTTDLTNNVTNVDFRYEDVGLNLKVTPRISHDGYVNMKIHAELKDLSAQTLFDASIINTREADANVIIPNGHTIVLGGLMRDNNSVIEKKVPLLGDIPYLGNFFKKTETSLLKTELLIFITPHIIKNTQDLVRISSSSKTKLSEMKKAQSGEELKKAVKKVMTPQNTAKAPQRIAIEEKIEEIKKARLNGD